MTVLAANFPKVDSLSLSNTLLIIDNNLVWVEEMSSWQNDPVLLYDIYDMMCMLQQE
jgi:hypothetical protein